MEDIKNLENHVKDVKIENHEIAIKILALKKNIIDCDTKKTTELEKTINFNNMQIDGTNGQIAQIVQNNYTFPR